MPATRRPRPRKRPIETPQLPGLLEIPFDELEDRVERACALLDLIRSLVPLVRLLPPEADEQQPAVDGAEGTADAPEADDLGAALGLEPPPRDLPALMRVFARTTAMVQLLLPGMPKPDEARRQRLESETPSLPEMRAFLESHAPAERGDDSVLTPEQQIYQHFEGMMQRLELLARVSDGLAGFHAELTHERNLIAVRLRMPRVKQAGGPAN